MNQVFTWFQVKDFLILDLGIRLENRGVLVKISNQGKEIYPIQKYSKLKHSNAHWRMQNFC